MEHLEPELLAGYALGDDVQLDRAAHGHLADCDVCRTEVEELRRIADLGHSLGSEDRLEPAPPQVWDRIVAELDLSRPLPSYQETPYRAPEPGAAHQRNGRTADELPAPQDPRQNQPFPDGPGRENVRELRPGRRRLVLVGALAAAIGLIAGVLGTRALTDDTPRQQPVASTRLGPLEGKSGDGTAELLRVGNATELRVGVQGLPAQQGFYELWLINADGKRMVSLGVLDPRTGGTFLVPASLTGQGYRIVDVSLEPYDGNPEHSHDSVIRGTLPT